MIRTLMLLCLASPALAQQQPSTPDSQYLLNACVAQRQRAENSEMMDIGWAFQYLAERDAARAELVEAKKKINELEMSVKQPSEGARP